MRARRWRFAGLASVGTGFAVLMVVTGVAWAAGPITWSSPSLADSSGVISLSCPSSSLCVGTTATGRVVTSTRPTMTGSWPETVVSGPDGPATLSKVSCASDELCAAIDTAGDVAVSRDPAGGSSTWTLTHVDSALNPATGTSDDLTALDCPSVSLCVATDAAGDVVTSSDPAGGAAAWQVAHIDNNIDYECIHYNQSGPACQPPLVAVSCASDVSCVTLDWEGDVDDEFSSTNPAGGQAAWGPAPGGPTLSEGYPGGLSCPTESLCMATDLYANRIFSGGATQPATSNSVTIGSTDDNFPGIWCASARLCFAAVHAEESTTLYASTNPTGPASAWPISLALAPQHTSGIASVTCPSTQLCFAATYSGQIIVGHPTPTTRQTKAWLRHLLSVGNATHLLRRGQYRLRATPLDAGKLSISWQLRIPGRRGHHLIAAETLRFQTSTSKTAAIKLNPRAHSLLTEHHGQVQLTERASYTPLGSKPVTAIRKVSRRN